MNTLVEQQTRHRRQAAMNLCDNQLSTLHEVILLTLLFSSNSKKESFAMRFWNTDSSPAQRLCLIWVFSVVLDMYISKHCVEVPITAGGPAGSQLQAIWTVEMKPHQAAKEKGQCLEKSYTLQPLKGRTVLSRRNIPLIMLSQALLWTKEKCTDTSVYTDLCDRHIHSQIQTVIG